jgi:hypothetical protein
VIQMALAERGTPEWRSQQAREAAAKRITNLEGARLKGEEWLQQMEEKKRVVGPALTKAGCRIASEYRRYNFIDDEDFLDIIDGEEDGTPAYPTK